LRFINELKNTTFISSSGKTPQFQKFATLFRNDMKKLLESLGATNVKISTGHFYLSGFFTSSNGQIYYFSISDVRFFPNSPMLLRTAKAYDDYTGGSNGSIPLDNSFEKNMEKAIK